MRPYPAVLTLFSIALALSTSGCTTYLAKPTEALPAHVVKCDMGGEATAMFGVALYGWFVHHNCVKKWEARGYTVHGEPECAYIRDDESDRTPEAIKLRGACRKNPPAWVPDWRLEMLRQ